MPMCPRKPRRDDLRAGARLCRPRPRRLLRPQCPHLHRCRRPSAPTLAGDLDTLLAKAKAYRPLAQLVLAKIKSVRPGAAFTARESSLAIGDPGVFAALGISAKELRLHLALGDHPFDDVVKKGQAGGGLGKGETLSHMLVLTDARQVDQRFVDLVALAKANG